jgi:hypothetical protein
MDNRSLLDQLMGKDRNAPTFKGITEQWKDTTMCKPYILDFCPYDILYNTKISIGTCRHTHSDVVRNQFESSLDKDKSALQKKYELDLLTNLERIVDNIDGRVRKQADRIRLSNRTDLVLPSDKQTALDEMNSEISVSMKQVEKLAEQGLFDDSSLLMSKVEELTKRANEFRQTAEDRYFKRETVCEVCSAVTTFKASGEGKDELIREHLRGRQHSGMELIHAKIIEIKTHHCIKLSRRDREFVPTEGVQNERRGPNEDARIPIDLVDHDHDDLSVNVKQSRSRGDRVQSVTALRGRQKSRSRSPRRPRSPSTPRSMVSVTFD